MKVTRTHLIDLARKETLQRAEHDDVLSGYLIGSVAGGEPLLGGTADIDLVLIYENHREPQREAVRLSHQIHLDISHHPKDLYLKPPDLRIDPWLGPALCEPIFLHDPAHFFEWAQAGARGQFYRPDHVHARATAFLKRARQGQSLLALSQRWLRIYLKAVLEAANAVASLDRFPVSGRRLALELAGQADHLDYSALYTDFQGLIGGNMLSTWDIADTLATWARAYDIASAGAAEPRLPQCRRDYYLHGFQALVEAGHTDAILWPLLRIWERTIANLPDIEDNQAHFDAWIHFLEQLQLDDGQKDQRSQMLQTYIEQNAAWISHWARRTGA